MLGRHCINVIQMFGACWVDSNNTTFLSLSQDKLLEKAVIFLEMWGYALDLLSWHNPGY